MTRRLWRREAGEIHSDRWGSRVNEPALGRWRGGVLMSTPSPGRGAFVTARCNAEQRLLTLELTRNTRLLLGDQPPYLRHQETHHQPHH